MIRRLRGSTSVRIGRTVVVDVRGCFLLRFLPIDAPPSERRNAQGPIWGRSPEKQLGKPTNPVDSPIVAPPGVEPGLS